MTDKEQELYNQLCEYLSQSEVETLDELLNEISKNNNLPM